MISNSSNILRNQLPKILVSMRKCSNKNSCFLNVLKKNFLTLKNQNRYYVKKNEFYLVNEKITLIQKNIKNNYCQKIGNLVILNSRNEIKISFEAITYSIFYNETDSLNVINEKILGINEKIQIVEIVNSENQEVLSEEQKNKLLFKDFLRSPFFIKINKHLSLTYIPGILPHIFSQNNEIIKEFQTKNPDFISDSETIKNIIFINLFKLKQTNAGDSKKYDVAKISFITDLNKSLGQRESFLKSLYDKQVLANKVVNDKLNFSTKMACRLGLLFAVSHFSIFYALIYHFFAWDVIEPITYLVGNVYWIIGLGFLASRNKKLEYELLYYDSIKEMYFNKYAKQFSYCEEEKLKLEEELKTIEDLKSQLKDI